MMTFLKFMDVYKSMFLNTIVFVFGANSISKYLELNFLGFSAAALGLMTGIILIDFFTGMRASAHKARQEGKKKYYQSSRGLKTVWKLMGYSIFIIFLAIGEDLFNQYDLQNFPKNLINWIRVITFVLFFLWEFYSIGENIESRYGTKPKIFSFFEQIADIIENRILKKLDNLLNTNSKEDSDIEN